MYYVLYIIIIFLQEIIFLSLTLNLLLEIKYSAGQ